MARGDIVGGRLGKVMQMVEPTIRESIVAGVLPDMLGDFVFRVSAMGEDSLVGSLAMVFDAAMNDPSMLSRNRSE